MNAFGHFTFGCRHEAQSLLLRRQSGLIRTVLFTSERCGDTRFRLSQISTWTWSRKYIGCFLRRLVLPFFETHGKGMLASALKTGMEVADDLLEGQSLKKSAKKRVPAGIKRTVQSLSRQSGSGIRRQRKAKRIRRKNNRSKAPDIFW